MNKRQISQKTIYYDICILFVIIDKFSESFCRSFLVFYCRSFHAIDHNNNFLHSASWRAKEFVCVGILRNIIFKSRNKRADNNETSDK